MKYSCANCSGHAEIEHYDNTALTCPHCQTAAIFRPLDESLAIAVVQDEAPPPPVLGTVSLIEMSGRDQSPETVASAINQLATYCTGQEIVLRVVVQSRIMSISVKPDIIAATNRRIIILHRGIFSRQMWDSLWIDIADVRIEEKLTGATISVSMVNGNGATLDHLPKESAREFYRFCQSREEEMRVVRYAQRIHTAAAGAAKVNVNIGH